MKLTPRSPGKCPACGSQFTKQKARETFCSLRCAVRSHIDERGPEECWPWTGGLANGYGAGTFGGRRYKASRVILAEKLGSDLPRDIFALHRCDNPPCCNPAHLFPGTPADNMKDKTAKGRGRSISPALKGEAHGKARLTEEAVLFIRANKELGPTALGKMYGVERNVIWKVTANKTWRHLL